MWCAHQLGTPILPACLATHLHSRPSPQPHPLTCLPAPPPPHPSASHAAVLLSACADAPPLETIESMAEGQGAFKLFGDVEPLPLMFSGELEGASSAPGGLERAAAASSGGSGSQPPQLAAEKTFRLFGDIAPLPLR
jgi:hypothetical protein